MKHTWPWGQIHWVHLGVCSSGPCWALPQTSNDLTEKLKGFIKFQMFEVCQIYSHGVQWYGMIVVALQGGHWALLWYRSDPFYPKQLLHTCLQSDGRRAVPMVSSESSETFKHHQYWTVVTMKMRYARTRSNIWSETEGTHYTCTAKCDDKERFFLHIQLQYLARKATQLPRPRLDLQLIFYQMEWFQQSTSSAPQFKLDFRWQSVTSDCQSQVCFLRENARPGGHRRACTNRWCIH